MDQNLWSSRTPDELLHIKRKNVFFVILKLKVFTPSDEIEFIKSLQGCAFFQFRTTDGETKDALGEDTCLGSMSSNQTCSGINPMSLKVLLI